MAFKLCCIFSNYLPRVLIGVRLLREDVCSLSTASFWNKRLYSHESMPERVFLDQATSQFGKINLHCSCDLDIVPFIPREPDFNNHVLLRLKKKDEYSKNYANTARNFDDFVKVDIKKDVFDHFFYLEGTIQKLSELDVIKAVLEIPPKFGEYVA